MTLDISKEVLIIPEPIKNNKAEPLIILPRSNCILRIAADEIIEHKVITIKKQENNDEVIIANSVSSVIENQIIGNELTNRSNDK